MQDATRVDMICSLLTRGARALQAVGIDRPRFEARLLLAHALEAAPETLTRDPQRLAPVDTFEALLARRVQREPMARILGRREFWSMEFQVSAATLVPRPESETLIEAALSMFPEPAGVRRILDLGTGTGCLLLAGLREFPAAFGLGVDLAPAALRTAAVNAAALALTARARFAAGNWADAVAGRFDLVLANPPYIPTGDIAGLMPEVARHDPAAALDGGPDGLQAYRLIIPDLPRLLAKGGCAVLEAGSGQAEAIAALARHAGFSATLRGDLAGTPRAVLLRPAAR